MLCCGFVGRGVKYVALPLVFSYFLLAISRDPGDRKPSHNFWCQEWDQNFPGACISHLRHNRGAQLLFMATTSDYGSWTLEDLRIEASRRSIAFISKDGIKTLASKLRVHDKLMTQIETHSIEGIEPIGTGEEPVSGISFEQRLRLQEYELQMLELRRKIQQEKREAEKEKRAYERENGNMRGKKRARKKRE